MPDIVSGLQAVRASITPRNILAGLGFLRSLQAPTHENLRTFLRTLVLGLVLGAPALAEPYADEIAFIVERTGYEVRGPVPPVRIVQEWQIVAKGRFSGRENLISLAQDRRPETRLGRATLVHELVHWLQWTNDRRICEPEAYRIQAAWLTEREGMSENSAAIRKWLGAARRNWGSKTC